jgi:hypothetical protein
LVLFHASGQVDHDIPTYASKTENLFRPDYIKRYGIKSIHGAYRTKADSDIIRPTLRSYFFEFNKNGQLIKEFRATYGDTVFHTYDYDAEFRLSRMRCSDKFGAYLYNYEYDSFGRLISKEYRRSQDTVPDPYFFYLDSTFTQSVERFTYVEMTAGAYMKQYLNENGKVYLEELHFFDEQQRPVRRESHTLNGTARVEVDIVYNEKGLVAAVENLVLMPNEIRTRREVEYDEKGNRLAEKLYHNGEYKTELQHVFNSDTYLPEAIIWRDVKTNNLTIADFGQLTFF